MNKRQRKKARRRRVVMISDRVVYFDKPLCPGESATALGFDFSIPPHIKLGRRVNVRCDFHPW